ncbi:MAG: FAD-binding protein [Atopobiaceae bacterium]|nr:FAD-binding protein [Atopobiaceae bacterium]
MIEVNGLRIPLARLDGTQKSELVACRKAVARKLGIREGRIDHLELRKRSIDARKRSSIVLIFTVRITVRGNEAELVRNRRNNARLVETNGYRLPEPPTLSIDARPVVVGAGCAGLFCALALASAGLQPLLVERGDDAEQRTAAVAHFNNTGALDPQSNIQFGLGGAGTFSDGKLTTGTKSPAHRLILEALVKAGAQRRILWDAKPHVGSDVLPDVVTNLVARIQELGGEVRYRTSMTGLEVRNGRVVAVRLLQSGREERVFADDVVLACGHSARDVFEMLRAANVEMERKTFAMGVRIEHLQKDIDRALYGRAAGHPALGAAPYKLAEHLRNGRSAFSFCMCPGGYVVAAASEQGGVVTNGMSLSARDGANANAALLANVFPEDLPGTDVLAGVELQRTCERMAFGQGGGSFVAPAQLVGDFLQGVPSTAAGRVSPTYPRGVTWDAAADALPAYAQDALREAIPRMARKLHGFDATDAVITGVETRSSSPVRVVRGKNLESVSTSGLWPCGEGAGYAGGIMSAATDGLRTAEAIVSCQRIREGT